jgi:hypothetical protein
MSSDVIAQAGNSATRSAGVGPNRGWISRYRASWLAVLLIALVFAAMAFQTPLQRFDRIAFFDAGGALAIQDLIERGYRPAIDFGYPYGLLPLFLDRLWYGIAGLGPSALRVEVITWAVFSAWGMARFAANRRIGLAGLALIMLAVPDLISVTYMTAVQVLEQALLINALAEQARGRRALALALVTVCCFVKPSLAFFQGLAVLIAIVAANRRAERGAWVRALGPAAVTAVILGVLLAVTFGRLPFFLTIVPRTGRAVYRINDLGFFNAGGRQWISIRGGGLLDYFRYEIGFWIIGTIFLFWGGLFALWRRARGVSTGDLAENDEVIATCAAVHIAFVVFVFGHQGTWVYSLPMLVLGLAALANRGRWHNAVVWALVLLLLVNDRSKAVEIVRRWRTDAPSAVTLGLWASPLERAEWVRALELSRGRPTALLAMCDGAALFVPGFAPPVGGYYVPGSPVPIEAHRKAEQLAAAQVIISAHPPDWTGFNFWPEIKAALDGRECLLNGQSLWVYGRAAPRSPASTPIETSRPSPRP